jgi:hypothetical protein
MSRARSIGVAAALAMFVYLGATATDTRVGELITAVQAALKPDGPMPFDLIDCLCAPSVSGPRFLEIPMAVAFVVVFFGGLPLAVFGLLIEWQWTEVQPERRHYLRVPYSVLMLQIVSMGFSGLWLALIGPDFLWALSEPSSLPMQASEWFLPAYLTVQILASIAVIPVWRRLVASATLRPTYSMTGDRASRA